jgi:hypothetical protein
MPTVISIVDAALLHHLQKYPDAKHRKLLISRLGPEAKKLVNLNVPASKPK